MSYECGDRRACQQRSQTELKPTAANCHAMDLGEAHTQREYASA
jgi:hypothetical protein